jgi:hypothetical protein
MGNRYLRDVSSITPPADVDNVIERADVGPAGGGVTGNLIADPAFRHEIEALHRLGPRVTGELIVDWSAATAPKSVREW